MNCSRTAKPPAQTERTAAPVAVTENWVKRVSEASGLIFAGFRDFFGGAGLAEARMSAALLGCIGGN